MEGNNTRIMAKRLFIQQVVVSVCCVPGAVLGSGTREGSCPQIPLRQRERQTSELHQGLGEMREVSTGRSGTPELDSMDKPGPPEGHAAAASWKKTPKEP